MKTHKVLCAALALALASALCSSAAVAEAPPAPSYTDTARPSELPGEGWRYGSYYLYPLTRHIDESGIKGGWRFALYPITVVLDTAQLPFGAIAGLFGD